MTSSRKIYSQKDRDNVEPYHHYITYRKYDENQFGDCFIQNILYSNTHIYYVASNCVECNVQAELLFDTRCCMNWMYDNGRSNVQGTHHMQIQRTLAITILDFSIKAFGCFHTLKNIYYIRFCEHGKLLSCFHLQFEAYNMLCTK